MNGAIGSSTSAERRRLGLNGAQRDDHLGACRARRARAAPVGGVERGLDVQQHAGLERPPRRASGRRSRPPCLGSAPTSCAPTRVGRFGEVADGGAGLLGDPAAPALEQLRRVGMVGGGVAEQDAPCARRSSSDARWPWPRRSRRPAAGAATPLRRGDRGGDRRPAPATHCARRGDDARRRSASASRRAARATLDHLARPCSPPGAMRCANSGWSLRRNEPTTSDALQRRTARRSSVPSQRIALGRGAKSALRRR